MITIRPELPADLVAVESLLDRCFGADRRRKVSYRYRDGVDRIEMLCRVALDAGGRLVGAIRYWPMLMSDVPVLLLGPLAIEPPLQGRGIGRALVADTLDSAAGMGHRLVFLVGDPAYYCRFGFLPVPAGIVMPGEATARVQYRLLDPLVRLPQTAVLLPWAQAPAAAPPPLAAATIAAAAAIP